jgi:DNA-binding CsgD family transcriptional regulator
VTELARYRDGVRNGDVRNKLTAEDRRILGLLVECANDETVARRMIVSVRTVRRRIARILELLGVENRFAAGVAAASLGLIAPPVLRSPTAGDEGPPRSGTATPIGPTGSASRSSRGNRATADGTRSEPRQNYPEQRN